MNTGLASSLGVLGAIFANKKRDPDAKWSDQKLSNKIGDVLTVGAAASTLPVLREEAVASIKAINALSKAGITGKGKALLHLLPAFGTYLSVPAGIGGAYIGARKMREKQLRNDSKGV